MRFSRLEMPLYHKSQQLSFVWSVSDAVRYAGSHTCTGVSMIQALPGHTIAIRIMSVIGSLSYSVM
jgi:hypothetical protein